jgi:4a-hydroxytetrahydrobiopterin dehydratase
VRSIRAQRITIWFHVRMDLADRRARPGAAKCTETEVARFAAEVPSWRVEPDRIVREIRSRDFASAIAFVNEVAALAEAEDHHPDITIRYAKVELSLTTHDAGGLTENDFVLAAKIDRLAAARG